MLITVGGSEIRKEKTIWDVSQTLKSNGHKLPTSTGELIPDFFHCILDSPPHPLSVTTRMLSEGSRKKTNLHLPRASILGQVRLTWKPVVNGWIWWNNHFSMVKIWNHRIQWNQAFLQGMAISFRVQIIVQQSRTIVVVWRQLFPLKCLFFFRKHVLVFRDDVPAIRKGSSLHQ